ncbi:MAG TPA: DUF2330 domain-containing protein [Acidimicrobiales bacterium]|nr:DUF2330 domain-containing protein [Acidimicrobiales bacterium]
MGRRMLVAPALALPIAVWGAAPAWACGGLVGENGTIELLRTTTLAAYSEGVERYVTAFEFTGEGKEVGSIVPLPDVPTKVERGGDWTLQRLTQEVAPPLEADGAAVAAEALAADEARVILETQIDALDITVLEGGGDAVGEWALENGFFLTPDAPEVLDYYAERSPVFMAARFDAQRARELGQGVGDSTPIMATIPTDDPWVPLRILGLGLDAGQRVEADVFLLTEDEPELLAGGPGLTLDRSEPASDLLLFDLRSDERMGWVPQDMWLSYLKLDTPAGELDYDLAASQTAGVTPSLVDAGVPEPQAVPVRPSEPGPALWPWAAGGAAGADDPAVPAIGPGDVTVELRAEYSLFETTEIAVVEGTRARFVLDNQDPINHELIVGPPEVHARHATGTEAEHPSVPGEVSVGPNEVGVTTYRFDEPGTFEFACHLPGHYEHGMHGVIEVLPAP